MDVVEKNIKHTLDQAKEYLSRPTRGKMSEADTRAHFIDPIFVTLGWRSFDEVTREYFVRSSGEHIDYLMSVEGRPRLALEAKTIQTPLTEKHAAQLVQYCSIEGIEWAALTNGQTLQLFNTFLRPDLPAKRVFDLNLLAYHDETTAEDIIRKLMLLSRESIASGTTNAWLRQHRLDTVLRHALRDPRSPAILQLQQIVGSAEINATTEEITAWVEENLATRPNTVPVDLCKPKVDTSGSLDLRATNLFDGAHAVLLPTMSALRDKVDTLVADRVWRATKDYLVATRNGNSFLEVKRRGNALVIGVSFPANMVFPFPETDHHNFGHHITKAFSISTASDVNDTVANVILQSSDFVISAPTHRKHYYGITLQQLIDTNFAIPGETLYLIRDSNIVTQATLDASGQIRWNGTLYKSPSNRTFARMMSQQSFNGWVHWFVERDSKMVDLSTLRQKLIASRGRSI